MLDEIYELVHWYHDVPRPPDKGANRAWRMLDALGPVFTTEICNDGNRETGEFTVSISVWKGNRCIAEARKAIGSLLPDATITKEWGLVFTDEWPVAKTSTIEWDAEIILDSKSHLGFEVERVVNKDAALLTFAPFNHITWHSGIVHLTNPTTVLWPSTLAGLDLLDAIALWIPGSPYSFITERTSGINKETGIFGDFWEIFSKYDIMSRGEDRACRVVAAFLNTLKRLPKYHPAGRNFKLNELLFFEPFARNQQLVNPPEFTLNLAETNCINFSVLLAAVIARLGEATSFKSKIMFCIMKKTGTGHAIPIISVPVKEPGSRKISSMDLPFDITSREMWNEYETFDAKTVKQKFFVPASMYRELFADYRIVDIQEVQGWIHGIRGTLHPRDMPLPDYIKIPITTSAGKIPAHDNYDSVMHTNDVTPDFFRMLKPRAIRGMIYDIDIKAGYIIRVEGLVQALKQALFEKNRWIVLTGSSGFSKTTMAKVIAYDAHHGGKHVIFANHVKEIEAFVASIFEDSNEWLLVIDDLHRLDYGTSAEKLAALVPLLERGNVHVLITSRLSLEGIKDKCKQNTMRELETCEKLFEITTNGYEKQLFQAKHDLIAKYMTELETRKRLPHDPEMDRYVNRVLEQFGADFVTIGYALLEMEYPSQIVKESQITDNLRAYLHNQVEEMAGKPGTSGSMSAATILRVLVGACYGAMNDETVTVDHFIHSQKGSDSRNDIWRALKVVTGHGLLIEDDKMHLFSLAHARVAQWYAKALRHDYHSDYEDVAWKDMCALSWFTAFENRFFDYSSFFKDFNRLEKVSLCNCGLTSIPDNLVNMKSLKFLDLHSNRLTSIPDTIGDLTALEFLDLSHNQLTMLPSTIGNIQSLHTLYLNENKFCALPESIGNLRSLEKLALENNKLESLPDSIGNLIKLKVLNLQENMLILVPESLGNLEKLENIHLWRNRISKIPEGWGKLPKLVELIMFSNQLTSLPKDMSALTSLKKLDLGDNQLSTIPDTIGFLRSLEFLSLGFNHLCQVPPSIGKLVALEYLNLGCNEIISLPDSIGDLMALQSMDLVNNKLTALPDSIGRLRKLEFLNVDNNELNSIPDSIGDLCFLKELWLNRNQIKSIPGSIGKDESLKILELGDNQLTSIPGSIVNLGALELLGLKGNPTPAFPNLSAEMLEKINKGKEIIHWDGKNEW